MRLLVLCALTGCFSTPGFHGGPASDDVAGDDVVDAGPPATGCSEFAPPTKLEMVSADPGEDTEPVVTRDGLQLFFDRDRTLMTSVRATVADAWLPPTPVTILQGSTPLGSVIDGAWVTNDPRRIYFSDNGKLKFAMRGADPTDPYTVGSSLGTGVAYAPTFSDDESLAVYDSGGATGSQHHALYTRPTADPTMSTKFFSELDIDDRSPSIGNRSTTLVWTSATANGSEILEADWPSVTTTMVSRHLSIDGVASPSSPFLTDDGKTLYFSATSGADQTLDLYVTSRTCN